jgi:hypothetical protein
MATANIIEVNTKEQWVKFSLSNKPDRECIMDLDDYAKFVNGSNRWYIHQSKKQKSGCAYIRSEGGKYHLHREVMKAGKFTVQNIVDHINGNGLDCRKSNLRKTDASGNLTNRKCYTSKFYKKHGLAPDDFYQCNVAYLKDRGCYQAYFKKTYVAMAKTIPELQAKIQRRMEGVR